MIYATKPIVGYYYNGGLSYGFVDDGGSFTDIVDPSAGVGGSTYATGINDSGEVVGYYTESGGSAYGFVDNNGTFTDIVEPNANRGATVAVGINNAGDVVGYYGNTDATTHGFLATSSSSAAPEPSQVGMLALTALGLAELMWKARKKLAA